jgi:hypothetical protein
MTYICRKAYVSSQSFYEGSVGKVYVVASKDNWADKYVFDLHSLTTQQRLNDPRQNLTDFYYTRIRVLIRYKLADLFTQQTIRLLHRTEPLQYAV